MTEQRFKTRRFYDMYLEFHEKIFETHVKCMQRLIAVLPFQQLNQIDIAERINQQKPILHASNLIIGDKELEDIFDDIFPIVKEFSYRQKESLLRLEELNDRRKISIKELVIAQVFGDKQKFSEIAEKYDVPATLLQRIFEFVASPFLELCAEFFTKKLSSFDWNQPFCPICGNKPSMARVNDQANTRFLWCRFCDTNWQFQDMVCPFCDCHDLRTIKIIFPSDRKPFRIDACDSCKNYVKTVDELIADKKFNITVSYVETLYLDFLAKHCGYQLPNHFKFYLELV